MADLITTGAMCAAGAVTAGAAICIGLVRKLNNSNEEKRKLQIAAQKLEERNRQIQVAAQELEERNRRIQVDNRELQATNQRMCKTAKYTGELHGVARVMLERNQDPAKSVLAIMSVVLENGNSLDECHQFLKENYSMGFREILSGQKRKLEEQEEEGEEGEGEEEEEEEGEEGEEEETNRIKRLRRGA